MVRDYLFKATLAVKCHCRNWWSFCYNMSSLMLGSLKLLLIWLSDSLPGPETCGFLGEVSCPSCCWETYFNCKKQQSPFHAGVSGTRHCWWPTFGEPPLWISLLEKEVYCNYWSKKSLQDEEDQEKTYQNTMKSTKPQTNIRNFPVLCSNEGRQEMQMHPNTWTCLCKSCSEWQTWTFSCSKEIVAMANNKWAQNCKLGSWEASYWKVIRDRLQII